MLGRNGREFFRRHYTWPVIERKYLEMFERLKREPARRPMEPLPGLLRPAAPHAARPARRGRGAAPAGPGAAMTAARGTAAAVHQILATLGYGDAIGHEVLGIQRALRAAGYESEIIVETADPRLEDLTVDYRDMVDDDRRRTIC